MLLQVIINPYYPYPYCYPYCYPYYLLPLLIPTCCPHCLLHAAYCQPSYLLPLQSAAPIAPAICCLSYIPEVPGVKHTSPPTPA